MNFPDTELIRLLYTFINTPSVGGVVVSILGGGIVTAVALTLRWIVKGGEVDEPEVYAYPTTALHAHEPDEADTGFQRTRRGPRRTIG